MKTSKRLALVAGSIMLASESELVMRPQLGTVSAVSSGGVEKGSQTDENGNLVSSGEGGETTRKDRNEEPIGKRSDNFRLIVSYKEADNAKTGLSEADIKRLQDEVSSDVKVKSHMKMLQMVIVDCKTEEEQEQALWLLKTFQNVKLVEKDTKVFLMEDDKKAKSGKENIQGQSGSVGMM